MLDAELPDLSFPNVNFGSQEIPWDLKRWVYKGGASIDIKSAESKMERGELGQPIAGRVDLVCQIHAEISSSLDRGGRRSTADDRINKLGHFIQWADTFNEPLSFESVERCYRRWTDDLVNRAKVDRSRSERTIYDYACRVGFVLDRVLCRDSPILRTTRIRKPKRGPRAVSAKSDKQSLQQTFNFGHFLLDISDALNSNSIFGPLPIRIPLRDGRELNEWFGFRAPSSSAESNVKRRGGNVSRTVLARIAWESEKTLHTRFPVVNLRIQAEMHILMAQPGVNLAQIHQLRMDQWRYKPSIQGYEVRTYKHRRWGAVVFEIYSAYREVFERYLAWRAELFPNDPDGLLFPLVGRWGRETCRQPDTPPHFHQLKRACGRAGIKYVSPSALRNTNANWMLRRTQDPELTAAEKQHSTQTLLRVYERPSQQVAMVQIAGFWAKHDPAQAAAGPGSCSGNAPEPIADIPTNAPKPDCVIPSGCLFCSNLRDIDSLDHVWSLVTYRLLKTFELRGQGQNLSRKSLAKHPAEIVVDRVTAKLAIIEKSSAKRREWVAESKLRIEEGRFHPMWAGLINSF